MWDRFDLQLAASRDLEELRYSYQYESIVLKLCMITASGSTQQHNKKAAQRDVKPLAAELEEATNFTARATPTMLIDRTHINHTLCSSIPPVSRVDAQPDHLLLPCCPDRVCCLVESQNES
eukprot:4265-Heterococcus_DN1.PRE.3